MMKSESLCLYMIDGRAKETIFLALILLHAYFLSVIISQSMLKYQQVNVLLLDL
jgi:hypothetical protein